MALAARKNRLVLEQSVDVFKSSFSSRPVLADPVLADPVFANYGETSTLALGQATSAYGVPGVTHTPALHFKSIEQAALETPLNNAVSRDAGLSTVGAPIVPRANFQLSNAGIFYGTIGVPGGVAPSTVLSWNIDTLILSNRRSYNQLAADDNWGDGAMRALKSGAHQDIFAYVNVGKVDKNVDSYGTASTADAWFGGATGVANINFANFWDASWLNKLKTEVDHAIRAGADGLFLDDVGVNFELNGVAGRSAGENARAMMHLVIDVAAYARQADKGGSEFRIMVNGAPFIINDSIFGAGGSQSNAAVGVAYRNSIDAMLYENPYVGNTLNGPTVLRFRSDFGDFGKQIVMVDSMKIGQMDIANGGGDLSGFASQFGFIPLLANPGTAGGDTFDFLSAPRLLGLGTNRVSDGPDQIAGTPLGDRIDGGAGDDTISGGRGDDALDGGDGSDRLNGDDDNDTLNGGAGFDFLSGGAGNDRLDGGDSDDYLTASDGDDTLLGALGSDFLDAGLGNDLLDGGDGADNLNGGGGSDRLFGVGGIDTFSGGDGSDTLMGGADGDFLDGGTGFDFASYEASTIGVTAFMNGGLVNSGEARNDICFGIEGIIGSGFSDILGGDNQANMLQGYGGNDWLLGVQGTDTLQGGDGNDVLSGGLDADFLDGGNGLDVAYYRDAGATVIASLAAGGTGGEAAGDTYFGIENIWGSTFGDNLTGDDNAGQIYGFEGNDTLSGLAGDDFFYGGAGTDSLTGGLGIDSFFMLAWRDQLNIFGNDERGEGGDTFTDFTSGTDRIVVSRFWFGFGNLAGPAAALTSANAGFSTNGIATSNQPTFLWNATNRTLSFDADGLGSVAGVLLGTFQTGATVVLSDIWTA